jgi:hypothetical protein
MTDPRDCPHGVQYRKRMHECCACMEVEIERLYAHAEDMELACRSAQASRALLSNELRNAVVVVAALVRQLGGEARVSSELFAALDPDRSMETWIDAATQQMVLRCP